MNVQVMYTPGNANPWSQAPSATIPVPPNGNSTPINWSIQVVPANAGSIQFSTTTSAPGIQFTGTGNSAWSGGPVTGNATGWSTSITNNKKQGDASSQFPYVVNALYTPANGTQVAIQYDPEVEENPPSIAL